ncbi:MAG: hypothetical protein CBC29_09120 [Methylococcaceae bacterium TMED69]|nr:MAG: hypothetical protein CBC29_09120 [Methylococcaceae bacterium TMED69]
MFDMKLLQISDTHIYNDPSKKLGGVCTRDSLSAVLTIARKEHEFDLVIVTGDLSMDGSINSYNWLKLQLDSLETPYHVLPGNHDNLINLKDIFGLKVEPYPDLVQFQHWNILLLNTLKKESVHGSLGKRQLALLADYLERGQDRKTAIFMHHPAIEVGSNWLDKINLKEGRDNFIELTEQYHVDLVVAGHVHQESESILNSTSFLTTPSTCAQFKPMSHDFALDDVAPAFRLFDFTKKKSFSSSVIRVD